LWTTEEVRAGRVLRYQVGDSLHNRQLAVRSGSRLGSNRTFDIAVRVEPATSGYKLFYDSGRVLLVTVGGAQPGIGAEDISGGWVAGDTGFASKNRIPRGAIVSFRVDKKGNAFGIVVTYSGNPQPVDPGKLWDRNEIREGTSYSYAVSDRLNNQNLALRSGANPDGWDAPLRAVGRGNSYQLHYRSGRVVTVTVRAPE
jgi:hypothetical protein